MCQDIAHNFDYQMTDILHYRNLEQPTAVHL